MEKAIVTNVHDFNIFVERLVRDNENTPKAAVIEFGMGPFQVMSLAVALKNNSTLESLTIVSSYYANSGPGVTEYRALGPGGLKAISEALANNTALRSFKIEGDIIGEEGALYIAEAIRRNRTLQELGLRNNTMAPEGAKYIAEALGQNTTLQYLSLPDGIISTTYGLAITHALGKNRKEAEDATSGWNRYVSARAAQVQASSRLEQR